MGTKKSMVMGMLAVVLTLLAPMVMAQEFKAVAVGNYDNVSVMEVTGNYDTPTTNNPANAIPRQVIAKEFYRTHKDDYDFLVIFSNFDFQMPMTVIAGESFTAQGFYQPIKNDVAGIGKQIFDNSALFGSQGKLQGTIDMGFVDKKIMDPLDPNFQDTMMVLSHELLHRWSAYVKFKKWDGSISKDLLGASDAHWSFLLDTKGSMQYGNLWIDNSDGTFTSLPGGKYYSPLDLYLMGMIPKEQVPPIFLIENPEIDKERLPEPGVTIGGTAHTVSIDDIIAAEGERTPNATLSRKNFKVGCIYITRPGTFEGRGEVYQLRNVLKNWIIWFSSLTKGKAMVKIDAAPDESIPINPGIEPPPYDPRTAPASIQDGLAWLLNAQNQDGSWIERSETTERETAEAILTLIHFPEANPNFQAGLTWLSGTSSLNTDYLSRKIEAYAKSKRDVAELIAELISRQNMDGGWGGINDHKSNPMDTAWVLRSLAAAQYHNPDVIRDAIQYLRNNQNLDGGWGDVEKNKTIQTTVNVLYAFIKYQEQYPLADTIQKGLAWLFSLQNADGGFGNSPSTVYDTALTLALFKNFQVSTDMTDKALAYILSFQDANGGWYASPYQTALAVNALYLWNDAVSIDLAVDAEKIVFTPGAVDNPPQMIAVQAEVKNLGLIGVPEVKVAFYDGAVSEANKKGEQMIDVPARTARVLNFELEIIDDKAHEIFVVVDPENVVKEVKEDNNNASKIIENRTCLKPDLAISAADISFTPENIITIPQNTTIQVKVSNKGRVDANNSVIALYDGEISPAKKVGEKTISVAAGASVAVSFTVMIADGNRHIFLAVADPDNLTDECIENNNKGVKTLYTKVTYDFQAVSVDASPSTIDMSGIIAITARITNNGTSDAFKVPVRCYIDQAGFPYEIAYLNLDISAGQTIEKRITWQADLAGENMPLTVQVDPSNIYSELSETNNKAVTPVTIKQFTQSNLAIRYEDFIITPSPALEAGNAVITALVKNNGFSAASNIEVAIYQGSSKDENQLVGTQTIPSLGAGQSIQTSILWDHIPISGKRYITVQIDPQNLITEIREDDNLALTTLTILSLPDLAIATNSIAFTPEAPKEGEDVTVQVTVQNLGDQEADNVVVQLKENGQMLFSENIIKIAGHSQEVISFQYQTQGKPGSHQIEVMVDPENQILEQSKENNTASRSFGVQNADLWVSEPIFSPNGDGIKDNTQFFFRLKQSQAVQVVVVNTKSKVVRTFRGDEFANTTGNAVTWDGLNENGRLVPDSQYQFQVRNTSGTVLSMLPVIVDTDRSSLIEAIGTPYLFQYNLTCALPYITWWHWFPDESGIVFSLSSMPEGNTGYQEGIYTVSLDGENIQRIVPPTWCQSNDPDHAQYNYFNPVLSPDGKNIAFVIYKKNKLTSLRTVELWCMDRYGENKLLLLSLQGEDYLQNPQFSPDGNYVVCRFYKYIPNGSYSGQYVIKIDGSFKTEIPNASRLVKWSLDSTKVYYLNESGELIIESDFDGNKRELFSPAPGDSCRDLRWINKDQLLALTDKGLWSVDITGNGNHKRLVEVENWHYKPDGNSDVAVNPDGQAIAYIEAVKDTDPEKCYMRVGMCEVQNKCEIVYTAQPPRYGYGGWFDFGGLTWSPDGQKLAFIDDMYEKIKTPDGEDAYYSDVIIIDKTTLKKQTARADGKILFGTNYLHSLNWLSNEVLMTQEIFFMLEDGRELSFPAAAAQDPRLSPHGRYVTYKHYVDQNSICAGNGSEDLWVMGTLLNLTADLKVIKNKNSIILKGTAADLHFQSYTLQYADVNDPTDWKPIMPPSEQMVVNKTFCEWIPSYQGNFLVRLVVQDKAGNTAWDRKRVSWGQFTIITDLKQSDTIFSPNGDGIRETVELSYQIKAPVDLQFFIYDKDNHLVRTIRKVYEEAMPDTIIWNGRDETNKTVADGLYTIKVLDYDNIVEVDTTFPLADMSLRQIMELYTPEYAQCDACGKLCCEQCGDTISDKCAITKGPINIKGILHINVSDKNIKEWILEYGEGENPQEWFEFSRLGQENLATYEQPLDFWIDKRFRLTAIDWAGNQIINNSYQLVDWKQTLFITNWDNVHDVDYYQYLDRGDTFGLCDQGWKGTDFLKRETHRVHGIQSILSPISRLILQYHRGSQWIDALEVKDVASSAIDFMWDCSDIPIKVLEGIDQVRLRAVDTANNEYFSLPILFIPKSSFAVTADTDCAGQISGGMRAEITIYEDLKLLKFQIKGDNDPKYKGWTDYLILDATQGDNIPTGENLFFPVPHNLLDTTYYFRMIGIGIKGSEFVSNEISSYSSDNGGFCISFKTHFVETDCDSISNKAVMTTTMPSQRILALYLNSRSFDMQSLSYRLSVEDKEQLIYQQDLRSTQWKDLVQMARSSSEVKLGEFKYDTQNLAEGKYSVSMHLDYIENTNEGPIARQTESRATLNVDRVLPESRLFGYAEQPAKALVLCPRKIKKPDCSDWYGVDVEGLARDTGSGVAYFALYYSLPETPDKWEPAMTGGCPPRNIRGGAIDGLLGIWGVDGLLGKKGINLKLEVIDQAGNKKCIVVVCDVSPLAGLSLRVDRELFSPNHDGRFDSVNISYTLDQDSVVDLNIVDSKIGQVIKNLFIGKPHTSGITYSIEWDGTDNNNQVVEDGTYSIVMSIPDLCGRYTIDRKAIVEIDNTTPALNITYPGPQSKPGLIIEVKGSANDLHFSNYALTVPEINTQIGTGMIPLKDNILGCWNRYGLNGRYTIKLAAEDTVGNRSEKIVEVQLDAIGDFIRKLEAIPVIFSPNNDNKLETTVINYDLSNALSDGYMINLRILEGSEVIRTYASGGLLLSGLHTWTWDGKNDNGVTAADGEYTVRLTASHPLDHTINQFEEITVEVDATLPEINMLQPQGGAFIKEDSIIFHGSITDTNLAHYDLTLKGVDQTVTIESGGESRTDHIFGEISSPPDGPYSLFIHAQDTAQNVSDKTIVFNVDRTPPKVALINPIAAEVFGNKKNIIPIQGTIEEENLKQWILSYGQGENPQEWINLTAGDTLPINQDLYQWQVDKQQGIPDGIYTIRLFVKDKAGWEATTKITVIIDNNPPIVIIKTPDDGSYLTKTTNIQGTVFDENLTEYTLEISEGDCATAYKWILLKKDTQNVKDELITVFEALPPDGQYCLRLKAIDRLGYESEAKVGIIVDTTPPAAPVLSGRVQDRSNALLTWTANVEPDLAGYNFYRDNQKLNPELIKPTQFFDKDLKEGVYQYIVKAVDKAGWESDPSNMISLKIDLTPPNARILLPQDKTKVNDIVTIKGTAYSEEDFKEYRLYVGQGAAPSTWQLLIRSPVPMTYGKLADWDTIALPEDQYFIKLEAEDLSGNTNTHRIMVQIDNTPPGPPVLTKAEQQQIPLEPNVDLAWKANSGPGPEPEPEPDVIGYLLYCNHELANVNMNVIGDLKPYLINVKTYKDMDLPDGKFTYYVMAMDDAGNISEQSNSLDVNIDMHAPKVVITVPKDGHRFETTILIKGETPDLDIAQVQFQYQKPGETTWSNLNSPVVNLPYTTYLDPVALNLVYGAYRLQAVATDLGGRTDLNPTEIVVHYTDTTAPATPLNLKSLADEGRAVLTWDVNSEQDLKGYNVYLVQETSKTKLNTDLVSGTTTFIHGGYDIDALADGEYTYEITALDNYGNESKPSDPSKALIYTPLLEQPYTPSGVSPIQVNGDHVKPNDSVEVYVSVDEEPGTLQGKVLADDKGRFTFMTVLPFAPTWLRVQAADEQGNRSKKSLPVVVLYNEPPATPTGLQGTAEEHTVHLTWNPNSEPDLAGYFLYRDNQKINQAIAINSGTAGASYNSNIAQRAFDQNISTYWYCYVYENIPQWWQIDLPKPELVQQIELNWSEYAYYVPRDYDVQVWTDYNWLTLVQVKDNRVAYNTVEFKTAYRTQKIRLRITRAAENNSYIQLRDIFLLKANPVAVLPQPVFDDPERPDGKYHYQVSAVDQYGLESPLSEEVIVPIIDNTPPTAPINLTATVDKANVVLSWSANSEPGLAGYHVYRQSPQGWIKINSAIVTTNAYTDGYLDTGTYTYRVTAIDQADNESQPSNEASATIIIVLPPQPINLQITTIPEGAALKICWEYQGGSMAGFNLYRALTPGGPYVKVNADLIQDTCYLDEGLTNGDKYYYYVAAVDAFSNESRHSNEENAVPTDIVAPSQPIIFYPTISGQPIQSSERKTDIVGFAEPGALVELFKDGQSLSKIIVYQDHQTQTTFLPTGMWDAALSPDGKTLAYIHYDDETDGDYIWIKDIATGNTAKVIETALEESPLAWSPDSQRLIYCSFFNNGQRLVVYDRVTGLITRLTNDNDNEVDESAPSWSHDGGRIAFVSNKNGLRNIWIKDLSSNSPTQLTQSSENERLYSPKFSPDDSSLAYIQEVYIEQENYSSESLIVVSFDSGALFSVVSSAYLDSFDWAPGGKRIAYVAYENDEKNIHVFDFESGQKIQITDAATSGQYIERVLWSPYEHYISYQVYNEDESGSSLWGASVKELPKPDLLKKSEENYIELLSWLPSGEIAYTEHTDDGYEFRQGYPDGCFLFPNTILDVGINYFSAQATDAAGNMGPRSDEISVTFSADSLPDLETTAEAIIIYPASPMKEQTVSINAIIKNKGGVKAENFYADLYLADSAGNVFLLNSFLIPVLESGSEKTVHASWASGNQTGVYTIMAVLDAAGKVAEISEQNNFAFRDFYIAAEEGVTLNTNLNGQGYEAFSDLNIQTIISNSGAAHDLVLEMQIVDEYGTPVYAFVSLAANMAYGAVKETQWTWNTGSTYAGNYQVHAILKENGNTIQQNMVPFNIKPELDVSIELSTDKLHYGTLEDVLLDIPITNRGRNFDIPHLEVKTSILRDDISVFSRTFSLDNLPADSNINLSAVWNTGFSPAATYQAKVELFVDDRLLASSSREFTIDPVTKLSGTLKAVPETVYFSRPVRADFTIGNKGNTSGTTVPIRVLLLDPDTQAVLNIAEKTVSLDQNGNGSGQCMFPTTGYGLKTYKLLLQSTNQDVSQTLATATFTIKDGVPPIVSILSPVDQSRQSGPFDLLVQAADDVSGVNKVEYRLDAEIGWRLLPPVDPATSKYGTRWIPVEADEGPHTIRFRASDRAGNVSEPVSTSIHIVPRVDMTMNLNAEQYGMNEDIAVKVNLINIAWAKGVILKVNILNNDGVVLHSFDPVQTTLAADESKEFAFAWNTGLNPAGPYKVQAVLTKADLNLGEITAAFSILPILKFSSALNTDKIHYGLKENTALNLSVTNNGNAVAPLLNLKLKIRPEGGQDLFVKDVIITDLAPTLTADKGETWSTAQYPAGNYQARLEVYLNNELACFSESNFVIDPVMILSGTLEIVPLKVAQGQDYVTKYSLRNQGNVTAENTPVKILVNDAGQVKIAERQEPVTLGINESKTGSFTFSSQAYSLGMYQAVLQAVWESADHDLDRKPFEIIDITAPVVNILSPSDNSTQTGPFNMAVTVLDDASGVDYVEYQVDGGTWQGLALSNPALNEYSQIWTPVPADNGPHTIAFQAVDKAGNKSQPVSTSILIDLEMPFEKLSGTLQVAPNPVKLGQEESFQYTIRNETSQVLQNLLVKILVTDPATQEIKITLSETINLSENSTQTGTLKASTSGLALKTYGAVLKVETTGQDPRKLAETAFAVIASQELEADKTLVDETRLLVWVNDHCPSACRPKEPNHYRQTAALQDAEQRSNCETQFQDPALPGGGFEDQDEDQGHNQLYCHDSSCKDCIDPDLLKAILDRMTAGYKIVHDPDTFAEELRNPLYTDILILGDQQPLQDHVAAELREKVHSGTGLISSQWFKHGCSADYNEVFGITYKGRLSSSDPLVETVQSPITEPGTFQATGQSYNIKTDPDTIIAAWIKTNSKWKTGESDNALMCPNPQGHYAAMVLHDYGQGRVIYQAFDLGRSLKEANKEWVQTLLDNSLKYVHKTRSGNVFAPYELAPIRLVLQSIGAGLVARINESFPKELSLYDPISKQWIDESPWVFDTSLDANGEKEIPFYYLTPDKAGTFKTQTDISMLLNDEPVLVKQLQLDLAVTKDLDLILDEVINNLKALSLPPHDQARVKNALAALNKVKVKMVRTRSDVDYIIKELLRAVDYLRSVRSADMSNYRLELNRLMRSYAALYYLFVPPGEYLQGGMEASPNPVKTNQEVNFHVKVTNDGNETFRDLKLKVKIMNPNTGQVIKTLEKALILEGNSSQELDLKTVLKYFKAKTYKVRLKAYSGLLPEPKLLAELGLEVLAR